MIQNLNIVKNIVQHDNSMKIYLSDIVWVRTFISSYIGYCCVVIVMEML